MSKTSQLDEMMAKDGWIPMADAASKMRVDGSTVYRLANAGKLKSTRAMHRRYVELQSCRDYLGEAAAKALGLWGP